MSREHPRDVVLLLHGIRTTAPWAEMVASILQDIPRSKVLPIRFGFFDLVRFLIPGRTRKGPVTRLAREIREARRRFPQARISILAHSFGTYAVGRMLAEESDIDVHRLALCGSILPQEYRWDLVQHRVAVEPVNDCGASDVWPLLAAAATWGYGPSGTLGFGTVGVRDRFHPFGHSGFFEPSFVRDYWLPYFSEDSIVPTEFERNRPVPAWWKLVLPKAPLNWALAASLVIGLGGGAAIGYRSLSSAELPEPLRDQIVEEYGQLQAADVEACLDPEEICDPRLGTSQGYMVRVRALGGLVSELEAIVSPGYEPPDVTRSELSAHQVREGVRIVERMRELASDELLVTSALNPAVASLAEAFARTFFRTGRCAPGTEEGAMLCASSSSSRAREQLDSILERARLLRVEIYAGSERALEQS